MNSVPRFSFTNITFAFRTALPPLPRRLSISNVRAISTASASNQIFSPSSVPNPLDRLFGTDNTEIIPMNSVGADLANFIPGRNPYILQITAKENNTHLTFSHVYEREGLDEKPVEEQAVAGEKKEDEYKDNLMAQVDSWTNVNGATRNEGFAQDFSGSVRKLKFVVYQSKVAIKITPGLMGFKKSKRAFPEAATSSMLRMLAMINHHILRVSESARPQFDEPEPEEVEAEQSGKKKNAPVFDEKRMPPYFKHLPPASLNPNSPLSKMLDKFPIPTDIHIRFRGFGPGKLPLKDLLINSQEAYYVRKITESIGENSRLRVTGMRGKKRRIV